MAENSNESANETGKELGRNEPCYCGSGKKYKRCHGVNAAPKLSAPKAWPAASEGAPAAAAPGGGFPGGFDPSQLDPQMMLQFTQALQRLPRGQLQRLQGIMQRAMSGQDVTREAEEFERTLPVDIQHLMQSFGAQMAAMNAAGGGMPAGGMGGMPGMGMPALPAEPQAPAAESSGMTEEQARAIVAAAAAEGKISQDEAEKLLAASSEGTEEEKKKGFTKFWRGITGKSEDK